MSRSAGHQQPDGVLMPWHEHQQTRCVCSCPAGTLMSRHEHEQTVCPILVRNKIGKLCRMTSIDGNMAFTCITPPSPFVLIFHGQIKLEAFWMAQPAAAPFPSDCAGAMTWNRCCRRLPHPDCFQTGACVSSLYSRCARGEDIDSQSDTTMAFKRVAYTGCCY